MKPVLVLDAEQRSALAVTRSLGRHGIHVHTGEASVSALAGHSRYSQNYTEYPSPAQEPESFIKKLAKYTQEHQIGILMPMTELTALLLLKHRRDFRGIHIPFPDLQTVDLLSDKCMLMRMADTLNIAIPQTWHATSATELPLLLEDFPYPLVLKPGKSWQYIQGRWRRVGVRIAASSQEASEILATDPAFKYHPFLLQEFVNGYGAGIFALYDSGNPLAFFAHKRLREKPPTGGVSVLSESVDIDPVLESCSRKLLDKVGWHGIAMVEFKIAPNGTAYLMEVNTRFWGSLQLAIDAGVDYPWSLYQLATGTQPEITPTYKTGIRLRWLLGDLDHLYLKLRDSRYSLADKLASILEFIKPSPFRTRHEINRWGDMSPFRYELKTYFRGLLTGSAHE